MQFTLYIQLLLCSLDDSKFSMFTLRKENKIKVIRFKTLTPVRGYFSSKQAIRALKKFRGQMI